MNEYICLAIIFITTLIIIYYVFDYKEEITEKFEDANVDNKDNNKEIVTRSDEKQSVCIKPFTVTYDKDKLYAFMVALDDKITGLEYKQKMGQSGLEDKYKDKFKKYDEMYSWYSRKMGTDTKEAEARAAQARKEFKKNTDKLIAEAISKKSGSVNDNLTKTGNAVDNLTTTMMGSTQDEDNKQEIEKNMDSLDFPR